MTKIRTLLEGELEKAEATLAARNLVDEVQDMLQTASKLQVEDLAALVETMRSNMGADVAAAFQTSAQTALQSITDCLTQAKTDLDNAVLTATGEEGMSTSAPAGGMDDLGLDDMGTDIEAPAVDDTAMGGEEPLGRAKRDESRRNAMKLQIEALEKQLKEAKIAHSKKAR
jgi:hypothetical protein